MRLPATAKFMALDHFWTAKWMPMIGNWLALDISPTKMSGANRPGSPL
jgi:hypothetical protein